VASEALQLGGGGGGVLCVWRVMSHRRLKLGVSTKATQKINGELEEYKSLISGVEWSV
jgi:hypothetical protein